MRNKDDTAIIIIAIFVAAILLVYFISKILFVLGIIIILIALFALFMGFSSNDERLAIYGCAGLVLGIIFAVIGNEGINFFEHNPTGKNLLDAANTVVNATKDIIKK